MALEIQKQEDRTRVTLQLMEDSSAITRRGQAIGGIIAIIAFIGGFVLLANDKDIAGSVVLVMDAVFVFTQRIVRPGETKAIKSENG